VERIDYIARAESVVELVRQYADEAERIRHLPPEVAQAFAELGLYRVAAPTDIHGADKDPLTQMRIIEIVSQADGASGWNLMIGIETFGLIAPALVSCPELISDPKVIMASSTAAVGTAEKTPQGWLVNGQWQFVSGIHNAEVFGATVQLYENGERIDKNNRYAVIPLGEFEILDTWNVAGLRGSGSHDVRVNNVLVPDERIALPMGGMRDRSVQTRFPLGNRLAFNKAAVGLGIARAGIEAFVAIATNKTPRFSNKKLRERTFAQRAVARAEARLRGARAAAFEHIGHVWNLVKDHQEVPDNDRALVHILCSDAAAAAAEVVDWLAEAAGTTANQVGHPLERISRDARVVRQHLTVAPHHIEEAGRVLLDLEPTGIMLNK